jgi:hypothetical protein
MLYVADMLGMSYSALLPISAQAVRLIFWYENGSNYENSYFEKSYNSSIYSNLESLHRSVKELCPQNFSRLEVISYTTINSF